MLPSPLSHCFVVDKNSHCATILSRPLTNHKGTTSPTKLWKSFNDSKIVDFKPGFLYHITSDMNLLLLAVEVNTVRIQVQCPTLLDL